MQVLLLDAAPQRDAAPGGARAAAGRRTRCRWSAGAWAAASAARSRSRRCSPASPRWPRRGCSGPVKLRLDRDDDFLITGRRHCFHYEYEVGYDDDGRILGAEVTMVSRAGHSADLSGPVMTRALCHFDNAYWLPDVAMHGYSGKTNTQSNTAFRGFGGPQGAIAIEIHARLGGARAGPRPAARCGAPISTASTRTQRHALRPGGGRQHHPRAGGRTRARAATTPSAAPPSPPSTPRSPVLKQGLALTPVKFGISFNVTHLNQAGALVHVYTDGSVLVNHGGTEMGQGLNTKVAQVVAHELGLPLRARALHRHRHAQGRQHLGHRGQHRQRPERQGGAGRGAPHPRAAGRLRRRALGRRAPTTCASPTARSSSAASRIAFAEVVSQAYLARVQLWSDGFYATPGLSWDRADDAGPPLLLLRLRRGGERGGGRHAHRRMEAAARRPAARRRPLAQPGASTSARSKAPSSRAWAG